MTDLEAPNANITDLTGLEHATNLTLLNLDGQLNIRHLTAGRIKQPGRTLSFGQLNIRHLTAGRIKQPDMAGASQQLNLGPLTSGRFKQLDNPDSFGQLHIRHLTVAGLT